jgi:cellulose synthase/poly-beta-1,6-N-acetylglucosamine synthase-like glycosyltransferase
VNRILFWAAVGAIAYTYVGFPLVVLARGWIRPRPVRSQPIFPTVSVVIAAYNEAEGLEAKLNSIASLDYPPNRLEVLVASDGSTDATADIAEGFGPRAVRVLRLPRGGKHIALNAAVAASTGDVVVFTDANSELAGDSVRLLVEPFADPRVGGVAGDQRYRPGPGGKGERRYWDLDRVLKRAESRAGSVVSATGALYALRRHLFLPVPPGVTDDFVTSTGVIAQGFRLVFQEAAAAFEPVAATNRLEFERKVRIITRGLRAVGLRRSLLNPADTGFYAVQLFSHKVLRRLVWAPLVVMAVAAPWLWGDGLLYQAATVAQVALYGLGALGLAVDRAGARSRLLAVPAFFCLVNAAAIRAWWNVLSGTRIERWEPSRADPIRS